MNRAQKMLGVAGLGVVCAVGLGGTAQAATARPQANIATYEGSYYSAEQCASAAYYWAHQGGAVGAQCDWDAAYGYWDLWAYFD